ncbi:MAG TPA: ATPase domain-containing protein [Candidatus Nitrosotalea sp.]|nr:ATPase domain-containing protein [Candidatus Nitrosotalea sp.]
MNRYLDEPMVGDIDNSQTLYNEVKIPKELGQFLRHETYSLLIKGYTGTGKTTLALSILKELNISTNCLYISTRVSPDQLLQYHPWIESFFTQTKQVEVTETTEVERNHHIFVDGRLDEPGSLFERITNELMDVKAPTIIIDTWDAIGSLMDKEALMNNAKVLQTWRERARAKLIFVTEVPEDHTFDYLVDGIVELRQKHHNDRLVREVFLSKLRGIRITRPLYTFSLNYGFFHSYEHYNPSEFFNLEHFFHSKHIDKNFLKNNSYFSTGYHELDEILGGGFPVGSTVSIELDSHVNAKIALAFLSKIIVGFISSENSLLIQPFEKTSMDVLTAYQKSSRTEKDVIHVVPTDIQAKKIPSGTKSLRQAEKVQEEIMKIKKQNQEKKLLSVLSVDTLREASNSNPNENELEFLSQIKSNSDLTIFISRRLPDDRHTFVSEIADIRLSILEIDGTMFLQSETPWSNPYAISVQPGKGYGIKLEPIV